MRKLIFAFVMLSLLALGAIADGANPDSSGTNSKFKPGDRIWTTTDVKVRSNPGLASTQIDSMDDGNSMIKGNSGTTLDSPVSKDDYTWWKVSYDIGITGWSAENYLELVSDGPQQPNNFAQWSDDTINWATNKDRIGSNEWNGDCLRFVSNAFRQEDVAGESVYTTALNAARDLYRSNQEQGGWQHAPKGALIFFDAKGSNPDGHIGIYLGDGKNIINAYGTVQEIAIEDAMAKGDVGKYIGWSYPPQAWRPKATDEIKSTQSTETNETPGDQKPDNALKLIGSQFWLDGAGALVPTVQDNFALGADNWQNAKTFHMVVIGDSIAWGCGLDTNEKYSYLVANWLQGELKRPVDVSILAHTGATLENPKEIEKDKQNFLNPELTSWDPTISEEADKIINPEDVDLILLSGGINDVKVDTILNPLTDSTSLTANCADIEYSMYNVLIKLLNKCTNAKILVTSYYPIASKDTPESALYDFFMVLSENDPKWKQKIGAGLIVLSPFSTAGDLTPAALNSIRDNSNTFDSKSRESIGKAIDRANQYAHSHFNAAAKVFFVPVDIPSERSYGTSGSWLWKLTGTNNGGKTDDHKYADRVSLCDKTYNLFCNWDTKIDAVGHPNVDGAREYANAIESIIKSKGSNWLQNAGSVADNAPPRVQAFQVTPLSLVAGESFTIDYTISDSGGSGLKQVELWQKNETSEWPKDPIQTKALAGENGPISGSFTDSPSAPGKYWYGLHVVDNAGNWNDEKNSNTNNQPGIYGPIEVELKETKQVKTSSIATGAAVTILWNRTFGGSDSGGNSIQQTNDGGYIIAGAVYGVGGAAWLVKTNSQGDELWNRTFGDNIDAVCTSSSVQQTNDGGYILLGEKYFSDQLVDLWLIKTDSQGNELWNRTIPGLSKHNDIFHSEVKQTSDSGYIVVESTDINSHTGYNDAWIIKTDSQGNELWNRTFGGSADDQGHSIQQTNDDGYIIAGTTSSYAIADQYCLAWLIKTDSQGNELWNRTFGGDRGGKGKSVQLTSDGGYVISGTSQVGGSSQDSLIWLAKTDSEGNELWNRTFGVYDDDGASVQQTNDGGYIIAANKEVPPPHGEKGNTGWLIKTDPQGNELWNKTFNGLFFSRENPLQQTRDGNYIIVSGAQLIKIGVDRNQ